MAEFRWIKASFILLHITAAANEQLSASFIVRGGDDVTLPCQSVTYGQRKCTSTMWLFSNSTSTNAVELVEHGQISEHAKDLTDRLSLGENCSLVIKRVADENAGHFVCRQFELGHQQGPDVVVYLSVVNVTEHRDADKVTFNCSVSTFGHCTHTVKWLYQGRDVDKDNRDIKASQAYCFANVTFKASHVIYASNNYEFLKCKVTDGETAQVHLFTLSPRSSDWWRYVLIAVGLAALVVIAVAVVRWRIKAYKAQVDDNIGLTSNQSVTQSAPETNMADPEDGVSYASISYTKKTNSKSRVPGGEVAVIYSTVKPPSSSAGASANVCDFYATVNKP